LSPGSKILSVPAQILPAGVPPSDDPRRLSALALSFALLGPGLAQERVVNVYNWSDYIDPKVLDDFTKETGIKVVYDTYDNNEIVETKLLAGKSGYDIVVPSGPFVQRLIRAKVFRPLDKAKLPNLSNMWPRSTSAWPCSTPATSMPSTTCGAPPGSA
jgi:spermidine/putrescine-binding protein